jgi:hypothetical protein
MQRWAARVSQHIGVVTIPIAGKNSCRREIPGSRLSDQFNRLHIHCANSFHCRNLWSSKSVLMIWHYVSSSQFSKLGQKILNQEILDWSKTFYISRFTMRLAIVPCKNCPFGGPEYESMRCIWCGAVRCDNPYPAKSKTHWDISAIFLIKSVWDSVIELQEIALTYLFLATSMNASISVISNSEMPPENITGSPQSYSYSFSSSGSHLSAPGQWLNRILPRWQKCSTFICECKYEYFIW